MTEELKKYESNIKREHRFNWTPKFEESFRTDLNEIIGIALAQKTIEKLGWDLVYYDANVAEAKRKDSWNNWTEKIIITIKHGKITVKSSSLKNGFWDMGNNSLRVKLFIHAFKETEKEFDKEALAEIEKEATKKSNLDDYEIPTTLPQPNPKKEANFWVLAVGGLITSLILGFLVAFLTINTVYIIGLYEIGVAVAMGFALKHLITISHYTAYKNIRYLFIGMILLTYFSNQFFQYLIIVNQHHIENANFIDFMKVRFETGIVLKNKNTGWIGLLISWVLQIVITYYIGIMNIINILSKYILERTPVEVVNFAIYHFAKNKNEKEVREELSKMGWSSEEDQNDVFESIATLQGIDEFRRME